MNKAELIAKLSNVTGLAVADCAEVVRQFEHFLSMQLLKEGSVKLSNIGRLSVCNRAGRKGRNPRTGEIIQIPPRRSVSFRPSKSLTDMVNYGD